MGHVLDATAAIDVESLRETDETEPLRHRRAGAHDDVWNVVRSEEAVRVTREVMDIDPDEDDVSAVCLCGGSEQRRLASARPAPGRPEVDHDGVAAELFEP